MKKSLDTAATLAANAMALLWGSGMVAGAWDIIKTTGYQEEKLAETLTAAYAIVQTALIGLCLFGVLNSYKAAKKIAMYLALLLLPLAYLLTSHVLSLSSWAR